MIARGTFEDYSGFGKLCLLGITVLFGVIIATLLTYIYMLATGAEMDNTGQMRIMLFIQNFFLFVVSAHLSTYLLWDSSITSALQLHTPRLTVLLLGCLAMFFSGPIVDILNTWNQGLRLPEFMHSIEQWMINSEQQAEAITNQMLNADNWSAFLMNILVIALLAGVGEELLFRGVLQKIMIEWTKNIHVGIWITAVIFSAIHLQFFGFVPRLFLGALLGYLAVWGKSLWIPIIAHTLNNAMIVIFTPSTFNNGNRLIETIDQTENSFWMVMVSLVFVVTSLFFIKRLGSKQTYSI